MHDVVVMAVKNAVSAATTTFTAISIKRFVFIIVNCQLFIGYCLLVIVKRCAQRRYRLIAVAEVGVVAVVVGATAGVRAGVTTL